MSDEPIAKAENNFLKQKKVALTNARGVREANSAMFILEESGFNSISFFQSTHSEIDKWIRKVDDNIRISDGNIMQGSDPYHNLVFT